MEGLKGRLRYATGWTFARCGGLAFRLLSEHGRSRCLWSDWADLALAWYDAFLVAAVPRVLRLVAPFGHPVLFTDAACEDGGALVTGGAVLWCPGKPLRYFGYTLAAEAVGQWVGDLAKRQVIG